MAYICHGFSEKIRDFPVIPETAVSGGALPARLVWQLFMNTSPRFAGVISYYPSM